LADLVGTITSQIELFVNLGQQWSTAEAELLQRVDKVIVALVSDAIVL